MSAETLSLSKGNRSIIIQSPLSQSPMSYERQLFDPLNAVLEGFIL